MRLIDPSSSRSQARSRKFEHAENAITISHCCDRTNGFSGMKLACIRTVTRTVEPSWPSTCGSRHLAICNDERDAVALSDVGHTTTHTLKREVSIGRPPLLQQLRCYADQNEKWKPADISGRDTSHANIPMNRIRFIWIDFDSAIRCSGPR